MTQEEQWLLKDKYAGREGPAFAADCQRLRIGEPLAYVIGWVTFLGCRINLDSKPLIPRPETEYWVEKALAKLKEVGEASPRLLDLAAGSGCIGVAAASALEDSQVDLVEINTAHHKTIRQNLSQAKIAPERFTIFDGDLFSQLPANRLYHAILSNPPYIDPALDRVESSVKKFEPADALYGGQNGLAIIKRLIESAPNYLRSGGELWLEHEPEQVTAIKRFGEAAGFTVITHRDQYHRQRYSVLK